MEPINEEYYDQIRFWETAKDWQAQIGRVVRWTRWAPWDFGEMFIDLARLIRITPTGRAVIRILKDGKVVTRTVSLGSLLVPGETGGWGGAMREHAQETLSVLGVK
jgi:hypothetical protein